MAGKIGRRLYKTTAWQRARQAVFWRDRWKCTLCGRRSGLECDHIRPITKGGDWLDLENLRTVCRGCHIKLTAEQRRQEHKLTGPRAELAAMAGVTERR